MQYIQKCYENLPEILLKGIWLPSLWYDYIDKIAAVLAAILYKEANVNNEKVDR